MKKNPTHAGFTWIHLDKEKEYHTCTLDSVWMPSASTLISGATETPNTQPLPSPKQPPSYLNPSSKPLGLKKSKYSAIYKTKILATAPEKKSKHSPIYKI